MRLLKLELEKFGAFENLRIAFRPDARVHVVYGLNEAGKSTALAAVGALLFGVPERTPYAFRFTGQDLRVGAEIMAGDGRSLTFRRRKGRKNTLQDRDGKQLPEDALAPFLGALGEDVFHRSFGLDARALREGGDEMLRADGDVGAMLMAAASGLRGLAELRRKLDDEADQIFAERKASHRRFWQAFDRFEAARKAIRDKELRVDGWKKLNADIGDLDAKLDRLRADRRAGAAEQSRLGRLKRVAPVLRAIAEDEAALADYSDLPAFAPGAIERLSTALDGADDAAREAQRASAEEERLAEDLERIVVDDAVLAEAAPIEALFKLSGGHDSATHDLPRIQAEADGFLAALQEHARALGLRDTASLETARPTAAAVVELRKLISEGRRTEAALAASAGRLAQERKDVETSRRARESQGEAIDPAPLREKFAALGKIGEQARRWSESQAPLAAESRELAEAVSRLDPPADLEMLARTPSPRADDLARFDAAFERTERDMRDAAIEHESVEKRIAETRARLARLAAGAPLATAELIYEAREARDNTWRALRSWLLRAAFAPSEVELPVHVTEFERRSEFADRLSDEARLDAGRLAAHTIEAGRLDDLKGEYALAVARFEETSAHRRELERNWADLWEGVCAHPKSPAEMRAWLDRVEQMLKTRDKLATRRTLLEALERELARMEPILRALAAEAGLPPIEGLDCLRLAERTERRLDEIARAWAASRDLEMRFVEARRRVEEAAGQDAEAAARHADWRGRWKLAVAEIGLGADASIEAAEAALTVWDKALNAADNRRNRAGRVDGMKRDIEQFESRAGELVQRCAADLGGQSPQASARILNERLAAARKAETLRHDAEERLRASRRALAEAHLLAAASAQTLATLAASLPAGADPAELLARGFGRAKVVDALSQRRLHLIDLGDGVEEARLVDEMKGFDADAAAARLLELARENEVLARLENERYAERDRLNRERDALEGGVGAELAWQQRRNAEAELVEAARRWTVLKAASALLGAVLERHRSARRDPLLTRAGEVFATLTGGAFAGLEQSFDDDDEPRLEARRPSGERVPVSRLSGGARVSGLSEGSRDQLYLALRLAYIEDYAGRAEAPPFISDDIFASFDDLRTAHGLEALAAIGERVQPILFTHHLHVVEAARRGLGTAADVIRIE